MPGAVVLLTQRVGDVNDAAVAGRAAVPDRRVLALAVAGARRVGGGGGHLAAPERGWSGRHPGRRGPLRPADRRPGARTSWAGWPAPSTSCRAGSTQVDRARKDFIANASHELRTPLFSLGGFLELLENEDLDDATREEFLLTMREQVSRLTKLASDLLDLSRLDAGAFEMEREPIDLHATARTLVREFRGLAAKHGSRVVLARGERRPPEGDRRRAAGAADRPGAGRQRDPAHAARHRGAGGACAARTAHVRLAVTDDGPGIDERRPRPPVRALLPR